MQSNLGLKHYSKTRTPVHLCTEPAEWLSALVTSCIALLHRPQWECSCPGSHHPSLYYILRAVNTELWPPVSHSQVANTGRIQISKTQSSASVVCPHLFFAECCFDKTLPSKVPQSKWYPQITENMSCKYQNRVKFGFISIAWNKSSINSPETWLHTVRGATY